MNGTTYSYAVRAIKLARRRPASVVRNATPARIPDAPTLNSATAGVGSVTLAWGAPGSNGGTSITNYRIYRATTSGGETLLTTRRCGHHLHRQRPRGGDDVLLQGVRGQRRRRRPAVERALGDDAERARRARARHGRRGSELRRAHLEPRLFRTAAQPVTGYKICRGTSSGSERDPGDGRRCDELHEHERRRRHDLLLPRRGRERGRARASARTSAPRFVPTTPGAPALAPASRGQR